MLNYQSTSFHDANYLRQLLGLRCAPEFESWLQHMGLCDEKQRLMVDEKAMPLLDYLQEMETR